MLKTISVLMALTLSLLSVFPQTPASAFSDHCLNNTPCSAKFEQNALMLRCAFMFGKIRNAVTSRVFKDTQRLQHPVDSEGYFLLERSSVITQHDPFPRLLTGSTHMLMGLILQFIWRGRHALRTLAQGGPIAQPPWSWAIQRHPQAQKAINDDFMVDRSYPEMLARPENEKSFEDIAEWIAGVSERADWPDWPSRGLVYKPNGSGLGVGIVFITRDEQNRLILTMADNKSKPGLFQPTQNVKALFSDFALGHYEERPDEDITVFTLNAQGITLAHQLIGVWMAVSRSEATDEILYDSGTIEPIVDYIHPQGRSYETRYSIEMDWEGGRYRFLQNEEGPDRQWFGRLGSSSHFSNFGNRIGDRTLYFYPSLYEPLYQLPEWAMLSAKKKEFEAYAEDLVHAEVAYLDGRFRAAGLSLKHPGKLVIDVLWTSVLSPGGFPTPIIAEMSLVHLWDMFYFFGEEQVIGPKGPTLQTPIKDVPSADHLRQRAA